MNLYLSVDRFKRALQIDLDDHDDDIELERILRRMSRKIDRVTQTHFYLETKTKYFDGRAGQVPVPDRFTSEVTTYHSELIVPHLISVSTLKMDGDQDGVFEDTLETTDYILYPWYSWPKWRIDLDLRQGDYYYWYRGQKAIEIAGSWGYGDGESGTPYVDSGTDAAEAIDATETDIDVDDEFCFSVGDTILIDTEQMYVEGIGEGTITVKRGVNGTTAATHADASNIYIFQYPLDVEAAVLIEAGKFWRRSRSSFASRIGNVDMGTFETFSGLDKEAEELLSKFMPAAYQGAI